MEAKKKKAKKKRASYRVSFVFFLGCCCLRVSFFTGGWGQRNVRFSQRHCIYFEFDFVVVVGGGGLVLWKKKIAKKKEKEKKRISFEKPSRTDLPRRGAQKHKRKRKCWEYFTGTLWIFFPPTDLGMEHTHTRTLFEQVQRSSRLVCCCCWRFFFRCAIDGWTSRTGPTATTIKKK